jgi:hypothetical protein
VQLANRGSHARQGWNAMAEGRLGNGAGTPRAISEVLVKLDAKLAKLEAEYLKKKASIFSREHSSADQKRLTSWGQVVALREIYRMVYCGKAFNKDLGEALDTKIGLKKFQRSGPKRGRERKRGEAMYWDAETYKNIFEHYNVPPPEVVRCIRQALSDLLADAVAEVSGSRPEVLALVERTWATFSECAASILGPAAPPPSGVYTPIEGYDGRIHANIAGKPAALIVRPLEKAAEDALQFMRCAGKRLILVNGPALAGKKNAVRFLLAKLQRVGRKRTPVLRLPDGNRLPVFAMAVSPAEISTAEVVSEVHDFLRKAVDPVGARTEMPVSSDLKLKDIARWAKKHPACFILADVEHVQANDVVRALWQDYIGEILTAVLHGDQRSRILITTCSDLRTDPFVREAERLGQPVSRLKIDGEVTFCLDRFGDDDELEFEDVRIRRKCTARSVTVYLARSIADLLKTRDFDIETIRRIRWTRHICLEKDDLEGLLSLVWGEILTDFERLVLTCIAASEDGVRESVLRRMLERMHGTRGEAFTENQPDGGSPVSRPRFAGLVESRVIRLDEAQRAKSPAEWETLHTVNAAWRAEVLRVALEATPGCTRLAHYLIALEAADQARVFKTLGGCNLRRALARDIHVHAALVAAVDPRAVQARAADVPGCANHEALILPSSGPITGVPPGRKILRFAYFQLYKLESEGGSHRDSALMDDARLRLALLLPFFDPSRPWLSVDERALAPRWDEHVPSPGYGEPRPGRGRLDYQHLRRAFSRCELADLLTATAMAAIRVGRFDVVCAAARLGEEMQSWQVADHFDVASVWRLLRAEIDVGILIGGNPDSVIAAAAPDRRAGWSCPSGEQDLERAAQTRMSNVASRVRELIERTFGPHEDRARLGSLIPRGKLLARLMEIEHLSGNLELACGYFDEVTRLEAELDNSEATSTRPGTILGGRGARSAIRLLLDRARHRIRQMVSTPAPYRDHLQFPMPPRLDDDDEDLLLAQGLLDMNIRRAGRGKSRGEGLGNQLDKARIAAVRHDFALAFRCLSEAHHSRLAPGSSIEVLLELMAVTVRILIDAAAVAFASHAFAEEYARYRSIDRMAPLADYLELPAGWTSLEIAKRLISGDQGLSPGIDPVRAGIGAAIDAFEAIIKTICPEGSPHIIYWRYTKAWYYALQSRFGDWRTRQESIEPKLKTALAYAKSAKRQMEESGYRMHLHDAELLYAGIQACLQHHEQERFREELPSVAA